MGKAQALDARSIEYNKNITVNTVRWAMVEWLKDEHKDSIWAVSVVYIYVGAPR